MSEPGSPQGTAPAAEGVMASVTMAFNLGVAAAQHDGTKSVAEVAKELKDQIYDQLKRAYGDQVQEPFLEANAEYFTQIALLGYIVPNVCAYDEGFKSRLFELIERRLKPQQQQQPPTPPKSDIIVP